MFAHVLQEAGVLLEVLPLVGETLRQSFGKRLMPLRKGETAVADDDLVEAVDVHTLPRQVEQVKIGEDTMQRLPLRQPAHIVEARVEERVAAAERLQAAADTRIVLQDGNL